MSIESSCSGAEQLRDLELVTQNLTLGLVQYDGAGCVLTANAAAERIFDMTLHHLREIPFQPPWRMVSEDGKILPEDEQPVPVALRQGESHEQVVGLHWEDQACTWLKVTVLPIASPDGSQSRAYGIFEEITEARRMRQELERLENSLRQAQKMEAIGHLAGGVAHDFNNLLTIILGQAQMLDLFLESPALREKVNEIQKAGERASALTRQLLAFSRKQEAKPKLLNLNSVIRNAVKMLHRLIGEDIELRLDLAENLPHVHADPGQLDQVILNLSVNARDAMPDGGVLTIRTRCCDSSACHHSCDAHCEGGVVMEIGDTGCGMDSETCSRIFEPFFTTKEKDQGTGLGLATVHGIIKQSKGHIRANSQPGVGTSMIVCLPAVTPLEESYHEQSGMRTHLNGGAQTILVVEDEENLRSLAHEVLDYAGYSVLLAANAEEALQILRNRESRIELLLTDVVMPGINGISLARQAQAILPHLRILYMSGYTDRVRDIAALDPNAFLHKPFTPQQLVDKLGALFNADPAGDRPKKP